MQNKVAREFQIHPLPRQSAVHNLKLEVSVIMEQEVKLLTMQAQAVLQLQST